MIRVGTCSWADPEFVRDWYPPGLAAGERLRWYAEHFDYVEVNSTFYGVPLVPTVRKWVEQTPPGFLFDVKLHRLFSRHATKAEMLPKESRRALHVTARGSVVPTPQLLESVAHAFREAMAPLREARKLGALLLQMSPVFTPGASRLTELDPLLADFDGWCLAVELRSRGWVDDERRESTLEFFRSRDLPLVMVDAPLSEHFTVMPAFEAVTSPSLAYLRLHGRNEEGYLRGRTVPERFDWDYSDEELETVAERVERLAQEAQEVHVGFNNNRSSYAPRAAARMRKILGV